MDSNGGGGGEEEQQPTRLGRTPKELGERILAPTRRPDGTLRKPVRIRAGYVPQDEVAIYQSKGVLLRKGAQPEVTPGYDPALDSKPKTKSAKRNERKKEKKHQAALASSADKGKSVDSEEEELKRTEEDPSVELTHHRLEPVESVTEQINILSFSATPVVVGPSKNSTEISESSEPGASASDFDKRIRALKKKIRLAEAQHKGGQETMRPEQLEKMEKVEGWREELKLLENKKATLAS